jgi:hypothetical protein
VKGEMIMEITIPIKAKIRFNCENFKRADKTFTKAAVGNLIVKSKPRPMWMIYFLCAAQFLFISIKELIGGNNGT